MLQYQTIAPDTIALLKELMDMPDLNSFYLAGGTSLALQLGHRISEDLDFFTDRSFDIDNLQKTMSMRFTGFKLLRVAHTGFTCNIQNIKCDFYNWAVPLIEKLRTEDGLRLCSLADIAAFKMGAIITRKEKKDFWDIEILSEKIGFDKILLYYRQKYPYVDRKVSLDALSEIDVADTSNNPVTLSNKTWDTVKKNIKERWILFMEQMLEKKEREKEERLRKAEDLLKKKKNKE
jgi:hypothetical protein